jgi:hypothetical protein
MIDATESAEAAAFNEEMAVDAPLVDRDAQQQAALKQRMRDSIHVTGDGRPGMQGALDAWRASPPQPDSCHV